MHGTMSLKFESLILEELYSAEALFFYALFWNVNFILFMLQIY